MEFSPSIIAALGTAIVSAIVFSYFKLTDKGLREALEADHSARDEANRVLAEKAKAADEERWQRLERTTAAQADRAQQASESISEADSKLEKASRDISTAISSLKGDLGFSEELSTIIGNISPSSVLHEDPKIPRLKRYSNRFARHGTLIGLIPVRSREAERKTLEDFRSLREMREILSDLDKEISQSAVPTPTPHKD